MYASLGDFLLVKEQRCTATVVQLIFAMQSIFVNVCNCDVNCNVLNPADTLDSSSYVNKFGVFKQVYICELLSLVAVLLERSIVRYLFLQRERTTT